MITIILDTNVLINGAQDEASAAFRIIDLVITRKVQSVANRKLLQEYRLLISRVVTDRRYFDILEEFYRQLKTVPSQTSITAIRWDPEDNKLLEAAKEGGAEYIVTEDHDLLYLGVFEGTRMTTPQEFWSKWQEENDGEKEWQQWVKGLLDKS